MSDTFLYTLSKILETIKPIHPIADTLLVLDSLVSALIAEEPALLGVLSNLTLLLQQRHIKSCIWPRFLFKSFSSGFLANSLSSLPLSSGLVEDTGDENISFTKLAREIGITAGFVVPIEAHQLMLRTGLIRNGWEAATVFGWLWAVTWEWWASEAALGSLGIPIPLSSNCTILTRVERYFGPTGINLLTGTLAYLIFQLAMKIQPELEPSVLSLWHTTKVKIGALSRQNQGNIVELHDEELESTTISSTNSDDSQLDKILVPWKPTSTVLGLVIASIFVTLIAIPLPQTVSLSAPLTDVTPLTVSCVLPRPNNNSPLNPLDSMIHATAVIGSQAKLHIWPESAVTFGEELGTDEKYFAIDRVRENVSQQYGVWVIMGIRYPSEIRGEEGLFTTASVLVGPDGIVGWYEKQIPTTSAYLPSSHAQSPVWTVGLSPPKGIPRLNWSTTPDRARQIHLSPLSSADVFQSKQVGMEPYLPDLLVVSASAQAPGLSTRFFTHTQSLSIRHGIPSFICATSDGAGEDADSGAIDSWGRLLHLQKGGETFVSHIALPYWGESSTRQNTLWEFLGHQEVLGLWGVIILLGKAITVLVGEGDWVIIQPNRRFLRDAERDLRGLLRSEASGTCEIQRVGDERERQSGRSGSERALMDEESGSSRSWDL